MGTTSNSSVMINLAQSHYLLGDTEAAFEYAHEALAQNPNFPFIYSTLSDLYEASGDKELAQEYQQKYEEMVDF
ncbi:tetratricopeptide repeat protein [Candidatus Falkowbacteria bacterium]|nr:tetratricopeptide repeat protein [Candidatus Falkowbacteria bacterium]